MTDHRIKKLLIANRGEIAIRIQKTAVRLGIRTVSVAPEIEREAFHARCAEEFYVLSDANPRSAYINIEGLIAAALATGCNAVHPGYGFLSENQAFAEAVTSAGLIFVGPSAESIRALGDKTRARAAVTAAGVPVADGTDAGTDDAELAKGAASIGYPVIIKAAAGGGGRGMRVARNEAELADLLPRARGEAKKFFSDEAVFIEKYLEAPRHVEVQILGDSHGTVVHLGTRDCSTQRRNQKLVEEAPAPGLPPELIEEIQEAAVRAAQSVGYVNAGTAEFLVKDGKFYFLEMNTRIQVEHPVTEAVTGVDLVELQLNVASGDPIPFSQEQLRVTGHAIEFRINAENPANGFSPASGVLSKLEWPTGNGVRIDSGFEQGDRVTLHFDGMMAKVIVYGDDRKSALERAASALRGIRLEGVDTTRDFFLWLVERSPFSEGPLDIGYIEREFSASMLRVGEATSKRDPAFKKAPSGAEHAEWLLLRSERFARGYRVEIIHRADGVFVAIPTSDSGKRSLIGYWRRSRSLAAVISGLSKEVLEKISAAELWPGETS